MQKTMMDRRTFSQLLAMTLAATATPALPAWAQARKRNIVIGHTGITWPARAPRAGGPPAAPTPPPPDPALNMAWLAPNLYHRVISYSGTFVALQRNAIAPNGAWDYHDRFIPNSERKPIRIWLHVSGNDNGAAATAGSMRNWIIANTRMADALKKKGYAYQFVFSEAAGHVDRRVQLQTMPEAFEWVWKGYKP